MTDPLVSTLEMRAIDNVLEMGGGYVLDFTDRTFSEFFRDFAVSIDHPRYKADGTSKARRLRAFLRSTPPPLSGRVLAALMGLRLAWKPDVDSAAWEQCAATTARLGGVPPARAMKPPAPPPELTKEALLARAFRPEVVSYVCADPAMVGLIVDRMEQANRCIGVSAYLAAAVLAGSVLEALCLDFGAQHPDRVNRAYEAKYGRRPPALHEWRLQQWIEVLGSTRDLSPTIEKFGQGLRDFRNYVHPAQQLASGFRPDKHTADISLRVVIAAIDDLAAAYARLDSATR